MYCAALLYIEAHGGGTHLTDFNAIEKIIDVSAISLNTVLLV
jgi:hypothetical protein